MAIYKEPVVEVTAAERNGDVVSLGFRVVDWSNWPAPPLAPASLIFSYDPQGQHFPLHRLVIQRGDTLSYETYEYEAPLPAIGQHANFRAWWMQWQLELASDARREWVRRIYPDNGSHDHCGLTWETIAAYTGHGEGYESEGDWITVESYEEYIVRDRLRLRRATTTCG